MNHLRHESSPYLLQHAHNPVDWHAWRPEAFEQARAEDKPILVSIGYSTCHWCHVMERESFEDEATAAFMNEHFINIKVDREERPDVDQIYMEACQAISGAGGWPLNAFLTPDGRPFFAGTYYPPRPAHNRPSWQQLLRHMEQTFREKRDVVEQQADQLVAAIQKTDSVFLTDQALELNVEQTFTTDLTDHIFAGLQRSFDTLEGGFGSAPKFPGSMSLRFLLEYHHFTGSAEALQHLRLSLDKMIRGGIYDQLGGGFARYATDRAWLVPHFEKMLYDNALLVTLLSEVYQLTGAQLYRETIEETLAFVAREMTGPEGGFYSALDADSEGEEGKFYTWDKAEVDQLLGEVAPLFCNFYDITAQGNWEGKNILWRPHEPGLLARQRDLPEEELRRRLKEAGQTLFAARAERVRPHLDDKRLLSWNALMCTAHARAYSALGREEYRQIAETNLNFLLRTFRQSGDGGYAHTYKDGETGYDAFLDDYAFLIEALIEVYSISFSEPWLVEAGRLTDWVISEFLDAENKLFYFTSARQQDVILRKKELYDNALPSGNSTMALNLQRLAILLGRPAYRALAVDMLKQMKHALERYPSAFARWGRATLRLVHPWHEIAVVGPRAVARAREINGLYIPNQVIMADAGGKSEYPLLNGKSAGADTKIYVCKDYTCGMPVQTVAEVRKQVAPARQAQNK